MSSPLLSVRDLSVRFGGVRAVEGVSFDVQRGEVFTLIGPNGAGKTTVFNLISRIYTPTGGAIVFDGEPLLAHAPHEIAQLGIARTFQNIELFEHATVLQNLLIGRHTHRETGVWSQLFFTAKTRAAEVRARAKVEQVIEQVDGFRQLLRDILTVNATLVAQRQNEEMRALSEASIEQNDDVKRISAWAAILFAPTLVGTVYGMNFDHMPELHWAGGYPFALVLMLLVSVTLWAVFKLRRWI